MIDVFWITVSVISNKTCTIQSVVDYNN